MLIDEVDPNDHIPTVQSTERINGRLWQDGQEHMFGDTTILGEYNQIISELVGCHLCGYQCHPLVFQRLSHLGHNGWANTYLNVFACTHGEGPLPYISPQLRLDGRNPPPHQALSVVEDFIDEEIEHNQYHDDFDYDFESLYAARVVHSSNIHRGAGDHPMQLSRPKRSQTTLAAKVIINNHKVLVLFDSGSTTDSVTPEFAFVAKMKQFKLDEQVTLQLGCVGSRSKISYGSHAPVDICGVRENVYFDIVNIDRYDTIIGTPFLKRFGVCLDFKNWAVQINRVNYPTFSYDDELEYIAGKKPPKLFKNLGRPAPRATAPIRPKLARSTAIVASH